MAVVGKRGGFGFLDQSLYVVLGYIPNYLVILDIKRPRGPYLADFRAEMPRNQARRLPVRARMEASRRSPRRAAVPARRAKGIFQKAAFSKRLAAAKQP